MRSKTVYSGQHRGVAWEVQNFNESFHKSIGIESAWCFYLYIHLDRIPDNADSFWLEKIKDKGSDYAYHRYTNHPILSEIEWHYGITYYEKVGGFDDEGRIIKVGCDYQHYWDEGRCYNADEVAHDAMKAIDSFLNLVPNYKLRCCGNGKLYDKSLGLVTEHGNFYSTEYKEMEQAGKLNKENK